MLKGSKIIAILITSKYYRNYLQILKNYQFTVFNVLVTFCKYYLKSVSCVLNCKLMVGNAISQSFVTLYSVFVRRNPCNNKLLVSS